MKALDMATLPVLPHMIWGRNLENNKDYLEFKNREIEPISPDDGDISPQKQDDIFTLKISEDRVIKIAEEVIVTYKLNEDQIKYAPLLVFSK